MRSRNPIGTGMSASRQVSETGLTPGKPATCAFTNTRPHLAAKPDLDQWFGCLRKWRTVGHRLVVYCCYPRRSSEIETREPGPILFRRGAPA